MMPAIKNAPLVEAIFEIRWGSKGQNSFEFSQDEQSLLPGKVDAFAAEAGFPLSEPIGAPAGPNNIGLPQRISYRFRPGENQYPCLQLGMGIFTVNQLESGYSWNSFLSSIKDGVKILLKANPGRLARLPDSACLALRYQDAFYPSDEGCTSQAFIVKHFNVDASLPDNFLGDNRLNPSKSDLSFKISTDVKEPEGRITVFITDAIISGKRGLLMETIVESPIGNFSLNSISENHVTDWCEKAHQLQKHAFETLIKPSAYKH